uniref:Uncharacterized protein n=1 Tax=viral metagenome TaxID=1070528 RepID=A0A6M3LG58_9ZZZZ
MPNTTLDWLIVAVPQFEAVPQACARLNAEGCEVKFIFPAMTFSEGLKRPMPLFAVVGCREARTVKES